MRTPASTPEGLTCDCGYSLRATNIDSRCPECGFRVRRLLARERLANWRRARESRPEVVEASVGLALGLFMQLMYFVIIVRNTFTEEVMVVVGIGVGFCIVLSFSAIRRSTRNTIRTVLVRCVPAIAASVLWLLLVLTIIIISWIQP